MKDIWLRIAICQLDVVIVRETGIPRRNILILNMPSVKKRDM